MCMMLKREVEILCPMYVCYTTESVSVVALRRSESVYVMLRRVG